MSSEANPEELSQALKELLIETTMLHHHVAMASRSLVGASDLTNAQVSVLRSVDGVGARTVPQLASERGVARQPVQRTVDELHEAGLVRLVENPRHKRSRLVEATPAGRRRLREMERRQNQWTRPLAEGLSVSTLRSASRLLRRVRERLQERARGEFR